MARGWFLWGSRVSARIGRRGVSEGWAQRGGLYGEVVRRRVGRE